MIDWLSVLLSPLIGAGAGSAFGRFFNKKEKAETSPPDSLAAVNRRLAHIREWQEEVEGAMKIQERELSRLKRAFRLTRLFALVTLLIIAAASAAWFYTLHRLP